MKNEITIRAARADDAQALLDIYGYYIENTALTFEYTVPSVEEFRERIANTLKGYPYLVAESEGEIIGYAYAGRFHDRAAYAWNAEMTIYLKKDARRNGVGRKLYTLMEAILKEQGVIKVIAHITYPIDELTDFNSMQFHEGMGYRLAGKIDYNGYKFGRWYSAMWMDKMIGTPEADMNEIRTFDEVRDRFGL